MVILVFIFHRPFCEESSWKSMVNLYEPKLYLL